MSEVINEHSEGCNGEVRFVCNECDRFLCSCEFYYGHDCES